MQPFEFVMVVISIIVALGVAELLAGVARILRGELRAYWVHALWVLCLLIHQFQYCWSLFDLAERADWVFLDLVRLITAPILFFLVSSLLFPSRQAEGEAGQPIDLEVFYFETRKPIFALLTIVMTFFTLRNLGLAAVTSVQLLGVASLVVLFFSENRRVHAALSSFYTLGAIFFVVSFSYRLGESVF
ncbi:MAG: hypothetical protein AB8G23_10260 [Myxococcota bacterium]